MKHPSIAILIMSFLLTAIAGAALPARADKDDEDECTDKKECPLHVWMDSNMQPALEKRDMKKLAKLLDKVTDLAPVKKWNKGKKGWKKLAADGAEAARKGKFRKLRKSCKTCHDVWRDKYKAKFRAKPLPKGM